MLIMGDILKNRLLEQTHGNTFGIFMECNSKEIKDSFFAKKLRKSYTASDWNNFGKNFNCKYIFLYNAQSKKCYYVEWEGFIDVPRPSIEMK